MNQQQVAHYHREGFVLLRALFEPEQLEAFEHRFIEIVSGRTQAPERMIVMQDVMVVRGAARVEDPIAAVNKLLSFEDDPVLFAYSVRLQRNRPAYRGWLLGRWAPKPQAPTRNCLSSWWMVSGSP